MKLSRERSQRGERAAPLFREEEESNVEVKRGTQKQRAPEREK